MSLPPTTPVNSYRPLAGACSPLREYGEKLQQAAVVAKKMLRQAANWTPTNEFVEFHPEAIVGTDGELSTDSAGQYGLDMLSVQPYNAPKNLVLRMACWNTILEAAKQRVPNDEVIIAEAQREYDEAYRLASAKKLE